MFCKLLGIPGDLVDATEHLLALADDWRPRRVDLGRRQRPLLHVQLRRRPRRHGRRARRRPPQPEGPLRALVLQLRCRLRRSCAATCAGAPRLRVQRRRRRTLDGVIAIVQNGATYTYFSDRPIDIAEGAALDSGRPRRGRPAPRGGAVDAVDRLARASPAAQASRGHRQVTPLGARPGADGRARADGRPLPLQADGDYLGEVSEARYWIRRTRSTSSASRRSRRRAAHRPRAPGVTR